ncbi:MAG: signal recognition particle-docking protein FtsY [Deltaproteobacteria bacterium]|nr:signal recognition particle-docking protein FtsY [Deltaproteobacteria bacterium]
MNDAYIITAIVAVIVVGLLLWIAAQRKKLPGARKKEDALPSVESLAENKRGPTTAAAPQKVISAKEKAEKPRIKEKEAGPPETEQILECDVDLVGAKDEIKPVPSIIPEKTPEEIYQEELAAIRNGLAPTRGGFVSRLAKLFRGKKAINSSLLEEIEEVLITADIGVRTTEKFIGSLKSKMQQGELPDEESVWSTIRHQALELLSSVKAVSTLNARPGVILVVGVNGVGKTTTIGKLASRFQSRGKRVLLAAGDTFRAAAVLQLEVWGRRVGCPVVKGKENADPSSVIFDAIKKANDEGFDLVIADTAGRLHTKVPLMEELKKINRTIIKALNGKNSYEVLLVLDSTIGQNAIQQARLFREALEVKAIALTKLDGTAKGGVILGVVDEHQIPVQYIGLGERIEDLKEFDAESFVDALFSKPNDRTLVA